MAWPVHASRPHHAHCGRGRLRARSLHPPPLVSSRTCWITLCRAPMSTLGLSSVSRTDSRAGKTLSSSFVVVSNEGAGSGRHERAHTPMHASIHPPAHPSTANAPVLHCLRQPAEARLLGVRAECQVLEGVERVRERLRGSAGRGVVGGETGSERRAHRSRAPHGIGTSRSEISSASVAFQAAVVSVNVMCVGGSAACACCACGGGGDEDETARE